MLATHSAVNIHIVLHVLETFEKLFRQISSKLSITMANVAGIFKFVVEIARLSTQVGRIFAECVYVCAVQKYVNVIFQVLHVNINITRKGRMYILYISSRVF